VSEPAYGPVPVNVLTGFLGSGKTSLLRRLLQSPLLADAAVLINEFGEVGLDHWLLERLDDETVLLESGCVCCTIRTDLRDALLDLHERRARGQLPPFRRVVIETTGLADPAPIVQTIRGEPRLRYHYVLGNIVTVVDSVNGPATLRDFPEAAHQVAVADRLVVTKLDLPDAADLTPLLRRLNPTAPIQALRPEDPAPADLLVQDVLDPASRDAVVQAWLAHSGHEHEHAPHVGIQAFCISRDEPLDPAAFGLWFTMLLNRHGASILRVKGLLHLQGVETPVVIHGVQHVIHEPTHLAAWPGGTAQTQIVLIVKGLPKAQIVRSFEAFMRLGEDQAATLVSSSA
jgi:G3E family GTPase